MPEVTTLTSQPTLFREAVDFRRAGKYPKDVPLPTFLPYFKPIELKFISVKIMNLFTCGVKISKLAIQSSKKYQIF